MSEANCHAHYETVEVMGLAPRLRDDLEITIQDYAGKTCYLIRDPISSQFSRVGLAEYTLLSMLDGRMTIAEAIGHTAAVMGPDALSEHEAAAFCKWLIDSQLAETPESITAERLNEAAHQSRHQQAIARLNPLFQRLPLFNPAQIVRVSASWIGWIFAGPMFAVWLIVLACASYRLTTHWEQFTSQASTILATSNWFWLLLTWLVLKLLHEAGHAIACQRFGGTVREAGVMFVLLAPLPYVDVTSSWQFESKWRRIFTAAAGMYVELFVAAVAIIFWSITPDALLQQHAQNVVVSATVITLVFNLNPLMRFDGYYMLCDWLELPNLYSHSRQFVSFVGRRYLIGESVELPEWPEGRVLFVGVYGVLAALWRLVVCVSLILAAAHMFWGAGVILAGLAIVMWLLLPLVRLFRSFATPGKVKRGRVLGVAAVVALICTGIWFIPCYKTVTAPLVVDHETVHELRSAVSGFVRETFIEEGDQVTKGQLIATLENNELRFQVESLEIEIQKSMQRARRFREAKEVTAFEVETDHRRALEVRLSDLRGQLESLKVRASMTGTITRLRLENRCGSFVRAGESLATLGSDGLQVRAMIGPEYAAEMASKERRTEVHIWGATKGWESLTVNRVHPRATSQLVHPALGAQASGPLAVRPNSGASSAEADWVLLNPTVLLEGSLRNPTYRLAAGQTGCLRSTFANGTIGPRWSAVILTWLQK